MVAYQLSDPSSSLVLCCVCLFVSTTLEAEQSSQLLIVPQLIALLFMLSVVIVHRYLNATLPITLCAT